MGLSTPVAAVLIVLVTVVPMLLIAGFTARFISRNFRDAAGAIEPKPARRWFGLRRVKSNDSATTSLATNTLHYDDSWPDLESLRTYQDTPTPSIQRGIHESFELEFLADKAEDGSERGGPEVPQPLKVLKRLGRGSGGEFRGDASGSRSVAETDEGLDGVPGPSGESLFVRKKRGNHGTGKMPRPPAWDKFVSHAISGPFDDDDGFEAVSQAPQRGASYFVRSSSNSSLAAQASTSYHSATSGEINTSHSSRVLVPKIFITPEMRALDGSTASFWVAVEVSGQLCQPLNGLLCDDISIENESALLSGVNKQSSTDPFRHGCIHSMDIQIVSLGTSCILETIRDDPIQTTLGNGDNALLLAQVLVKSPRSTAVTTQQGHVKHRSDELIEDLEYQLGDSNLEYIRVSVKYNHSAFFCQSRSDFIDDIAEGGTKLETFATAIVKQHNHRSPWSPSSAPTYNPIPSIIRGHWESTKARERQASVET
ncbi:ubiquitin-conjugating enzyme [Colletotrichum scovillei]|nr:ubiquitin-conjugating enzyme [Colletotrichum scovillei]KAG7068346.1 ubiquitin-conjugating enzyme [Colletotrichum scovillei]